MWTSKAVFEDWHMATYHRYTKEWVAGGAIMPKCGFHFTMMLGTPGISAVFKDVEVQGS